MTDTESPIGPNARNAWRASERLADMTRPDRPVRRVTVEGLPKPFAFDAARAAVIVIDMQNDFCHPDGWLAGIGVDVTPARACIEPLRALLPVVRAVDLPVIWVNWGNRPDLANISPALAHVYDGAAKGQGLGAPLGPRQSPVLEKGSWSAQVVDELDQAPEDLRMDKHRMSGFWDTPLDSILRNLRVDTLFFGGVNADQCVLHTLADANFLGYDTVFLEDGTATTSPAFCMEATLYNARQIFGFSVTTAALITSLSGARS